MDEPEPESQPEKVEEKKASNAKKYKRNIKKKTKVIEACVEHPTYGGIRKPRKECKTCWELYFQKNPGKKEAIAHQAH